MSCDSKLFQTTLWSGKYTGGAINLCLGSKLLTVSLTVNKYLCLGLYTSMTVIWILWFFLCCQIWMGGIFMMRLPTRFTCLFQFLPLLQKCFKCALKTQVHCASRATLLAVKVSGKEKWSPEVFWNSCLWEMFEVLWQICLQKQNLCSSLTALSDLFLKSQKTRFLNQFLYSD